jgi:hypothetical protein
LIEELLLYGFFPAHTSFRPPNGGGHIASERFVVKRPNYRVVRNDMANVELMPEMRPQGLAIDAAASARIGNHEADVRVRNAAASHGLNNLALLLRWLKRRHTGLFIKAVFSLIGLRR